MTEPTPTDELQSDVAEQAKPYRWQITLDDEGKVTIDVGDAFPSNDSREDGGLGLTESSYLAVTNHTIGQTLRKIADRLVESAIAQSYDEDDDGFDD